MRRFVEGIDREQATLFPEYARGCSRRRQECDCAQQCCEGAKGTRAHEATHWASFHHCRARCAPITLAFEFAHRA
jgi:hypothetical protein